MLTNSVYHIKPTRTGAGAGGSSKTHKLVLTTTSLRNVVLANASDVLYYEVVTPLWERHRTRVNRLDVKTRGFGVVAELLNGHPPGDVRGKEENAKRVMAVRMYGEGEFRAVDEFLHVEELAGRESDEGCSSAWGSGSGARSESSRSSRKGKGREVEAGREGSERDSITAWFRAKDCRRYTWHATKQRLELWREDCADRPVAAFHKEQRLWHVLRISQYPYLEVDPTAIECLDQLIS